MEEKQWYLEYRIHNYRPGLLGDIASLMGMLNINILTINGVDDRTRAMLIRTADEEKIALLDQLLGKVDNITVNTLRRPRFVDLLAIKHGRCVACDAGHRGTFRFTREELGLFVDFLGEIFKREGHQVIGIRGMPRVGKTESVIAGSVCANKRWTFVSSTLLKQTIRSRLSEEEAEPGNIFIIDGIVSTLRSNDKHDQLIRQIMASPTTKVIEHPDIFIKESDYTYDDFHYFLELRNTPDEEINPASILEHPEGF